MYRNFLTIIFIQFLSLQAIGQSTIKEAVSGNKEAATMATIRLYNPTDCDRASIVEVPTGSVASPGYINWQGVKLIYHGKEIPFSIHEGKAHWKSLLIAPIKAPRAEDLLVFTINVPPGKWSEVKVVAGQPENVSALSRKGGKMIISYPDMKVVIDERTGLLTRLEAFGETVVDTSLSVAFFKVDRGVVSHHGAMGASGGPNHPAVTLKKGKQLHSPKVKLVSWSSTQALTEINFTLQPKSGPAVGLTYRLYPNQQVEILSDERPWHGTSPWLNAGLEYKLSLNGRREALPDFQTYYPFYGYKDYASVVKAIGLSYMGVNAMAIELGEESINGRFWHRKLAFYPAAKRDNKAALVSFLNDGLIVKVDPLRSQPFPKRLRLEYSAKAKETGELVINKLKEAGFDVATSTQVMAGYTTLRLSEVQNPSDMGITGDGFCIRDLGDNKGFEVEAGTAFGLFKGASLFYEDAVTGDSATVPLVSQNPVVDLRASCFNGGTFEVDFPYENDSIWKSATSSMIKSGMNVITGGGMAGDWQMPVYFKYMPALQSNSSQEYDPVSGGVKFSEIADRRKQGLELLHFVHARGGKVWLFFLVGAIPTTFSKKFPDATLSAHTINSSGSMTPHFMATEYRQYLRAYFKELLEVYPVDGFVLLRDDNGGVDSSKAYKKFVSGSKTKNPVWEQYLYIYDLLRSMNFEGDIAVYPYGDLYEPRLDALLPKDMMIVAHGSGLGVLTRDFNTLGTMGDTWLDNLYAAFRVPASGRMKRLLSDRGGYWAGGAYRGAELPWDAIGYFGWQPTASVNTFRYDFGARTFGKGNALNYVRFSNAYEHLWEIMELWLLPFKWVQLSDSDRLRISTEGRQWLVKYYQYMDKLESNSDPNKGKTWFAQVGLYGTYFYYHLHRLELLTKMEAITTSYKQTAQSGRSLPDSLRNRLIAMSNEVYALAYGYDQHAALVPGKMMASLRANGMTLPFKEWVYGYDGWLDNYIAVKQFAGSLSVPPVTLTAGSPFELKIILQNQGCMPWMEGVDQEILLKGDTSAFNLPARWSYTGSPMVFGDKRVITLQGLAPSQPATAEIKIEFTRPGRNKPVFLSQTVELKVP